MGTWPCFPFSPPSLPGVGKGGEGGGPARGRPACGAGGHYTETSSSRLGRLPVRGSWRNATPGAACQSAFVFFAFFFFFFGFSSLVLSVSGFLYFSSDTPAARALNASAACRRICAWPAMRISAGVAGISGGPLYSRPSSFRTARAAFFHILRSMSALPTHSSISSTALFFAHFAAFESGMVMTVKYKGMASGMPPPFTSTAWSGSAARASALEAGRSSADNGVRGRVTPEWVVAKPWWRTCTRSSPGKWTTACDPFGVARSARSWTLPAVSIRRMGRGGSSVGAPCPCTKSTPGASTRPTPGMRATRDATTARPHKYSSFVTSDATSLYDSSRRPRRASRAPTPFPGSIPPSRHSDRAPGESGRAVSQGWSFEAFLFFLSCTRYRAKRSAGAVAVGSRSASRTTNSAFTVRSTSPTSTSLFAVSPPFSLPSTAAFFV
eukprot:Sspe_Gene.23801::Locus_9309_Transcript_1_1_Confidence_1.000_Length_2823::g.23801::m.23801